MRLKATLISLFSILVVGLTAILIYCFWPAIKGTVDNSKYYTQEELQNSYDKGYNDGCKSETELTGQVKYYKGLVDEYYIQVNTLNDEITMLTKNNKDYETQVNNLTTQKASLQTQVENLTTIKNNNDTTISELNSQITSLQTQVTNLTNSGADKSEQITILNNQISTLQNTVSQLQTTNDMNVDTITSLNTQIASLNEQIINMNLSTQDSQNQIRTLNNKINELQKSITYYESYIANLESGEQVVATFEYDGSVYNIQIVNKGSNLSVTTPTSTDYKIFNGWTVNGSAIDLSTYTITTNTKIVADVTYKYDVVFKVGDNTHDSQIVTSDTSATLPTAPKQDGYVFDGWSIDGKNIVSVATNNITSNTTYIAMFTKLHTVTFVYEEETKSTQTIRNGNYATNVIVDSTDYKVFNGWKLNGVITDISSYKITADTQFIADITYKYDVKFMVDDNTIDSQIVEKNNYPTLPTNPTKDGYEFDGWSIDGVNVANDILTKNVTANTTYYAVFTKLHTVTFTYEDATKSTQTIRNGSLAIAPTIESTTYKVFNGWKVNDTIVDVETYKITADTQFVVDFKYYQYKFINKQWDSLPNYNCFWSDGENVYYSYGVNHYVLNKTTDTWETKTWYGLTDFGAGYIINYYGETYLFNASDYFYILDKSTDTWVSYSCNKVVDAGHMFIIGDKLYYSQMTDHYEFDRQNNTWVIKTWYGLDDVSFLSFDNIHKFNNVYYLFVRIYDLTNKSYNYYLYTLNEKTSTFVEITSSFDNSYVEFPFKNGSYVNVWTDGVDFYYYDYLRGPFSAMYNKDNNSWETIYYFSKVWVDIDLKNFEGYFIFSLGGDIYFIGDNNDIYKLSLVEVA